MVYAPIRSIKLGDYLSVQAHKPCSISHLVTEPMLLYSYITLESNKLVILQTCLFTFRLSLITLEVCTLWILLLLVNLHL